MIPKSGYRFSDKIMLKQRTREIAASFGETTPRYPPGLSATRR
jgi:hypothetical protein